MTTSEENPQARGPAGVLHSKNPGSDPFQAAAEARGSTHAPFRSQLRDPRHRLASELFAEAFTTDARMARGLLALVPLRHLMEALAEREDLRVRLLVEATGTHPRIAARKSSASASEDLQLALDEGTARPERLVSLLNADEWASVLGIARLWNLMASEGGWLRPKEENDALERARHVVDKAVQLGLLDRRDIALGLPLSEVTARLNSHQMRNALQAALTDGRAGMPFTVERLCDVAGYDALAANLSARVLWETVIEARLAPTASPAASPVRAKATPTATLGGGNPGNAAAPKPELAAAPARPAATTIFGHPLAPPGVAEDDADSDLAPPTPRRPPVKPHPAPPAPPAPSLPPPALARTQSELLDDSLDDSLIEVDSPTPEPAARHRPPPPPSRRPSIVPSSPPRELAAVCERLGALGRLPRNALQMPVSLLTAIEGMYSKLMVTEDAADQLAAMQQAFPNEVFQKEAMLELLKLHDPNIINNNPSIADESADSLAIRLLTEERQRSRAAAPRASMAVPKAPSNTLASAHRAS